MPVHMCAYTHTLSFLLCDWCDLSSSTGTEPGSWVVRAQSPNPSNPGNPLHTFLSTLSGSELQMRDSSSLLGWGVALTGERRLLCVFLSFLNCVVLLLY